MMEKQKVMQEGMGEGNNFMTTQLNPSTHFPWTQITRSMHCTLEMSQTPPSSGSKALPSHSNVSIFAKILSYEPLFSQFSILS